MLALLFRFRRILSLLLCVFVAVWLKNSDINRRMGIAHGIQVTVLAPIQFLVSRLNTLGHVMHENRKLREQNVRLRVENDLLKEVKKENEDLRKMLGYKETSSFSLIPTEVTASRRDMLSQNLIVSAGTFKRVRKDMPVITLDGVIGKVIEAYLFQSNVQLISDPSSYTGALFARIGVPGILECKNGYQPVIRVFVHYDVRAGDTVVTSGLGGIFPKGLFIGIVSHVAPGDDLYKIAEIKLHQGLDNIEHVFIMDLKTQWRAFPAPDSARKP
jgi:rod shape-determining protein MreC